MSVVQVGMLSGQMAIHKGNFWSSTRLSPF